MNDNKQKEKKENKFAELYKDEKELILAYRTIDNKKKIFKIIKKKKN